MIKKLQPRFSHQLNYFSRKNIYKSVPDQPEPSPELHFPGSQNQTPIQQPLQSLHHSQLQPQVQTHAQQQFKGLPQYQRILPQPTIQICATVALSIRNPMISLQQSRHLIESMLDLRTEQFIPDEGDKQQKQDDALSSKQHDDLNQSNNCVMRLQQAGMQERVKSGAVIIQGNRDLSHSHVSHLRGSNLEKRKQIVNKFGEFLSKRARSKQTNATTIPKFGTGGSSSILSLKMRFGERNLSEKIKGQQVCADEVSCTKKRIESNHFEEILKHQRHRKVHNFNSPSQPRTISPLLGRFKRGQIRSKEHGRQPTDRISEKLGLEDSMVDTDRFIKS